VRERAWRLFIAHPVPPAARDELDRQLAPYRAQHPDLPWTKPESWHLTLLFLGSVDPERVPQLQGIVDDAARQVAPYRIAVERGGGRKRDGEGVAWLALSDGAGALIGAATLIATTCPPDVTLGVPPRRTPSAHLTVARRADADVIAALRHQRHGPLGTGWTVDAIELVRSHLGHDGARYETVHRAAL
jgi:2'-5' RNA ligase